MYTRTQQGFTLIELMITVTIIGILSAIAYPNYTDHVKKSRIQEATSFLSDERIKLEQYYQNNRKYTSYTLSTISPSSKFTAYFSSIPTQDAYKITVNGSGPVAGFSYSIDQNNVKSSVTPGWGSGSDANCWRTSPNTCI